MIFPTIHLNGTSKAELLEQLSNAYSALTDAQQALCNCAPNGRDYYPQGDDAIKQAGKEHRARIDAITLIQADLMKIAEHIDGIS
jgi:hypothetical protein